MRFSLTGAPRVIYSGSMGEVADIQSLKEAVEHLHGGTASYVETVTVTDTFRGQVMVERDVAVFDLAGHPTATRAYAWSEPSTSSPTARRFKAVLHAPPVDGPLAAVRASVAKHAGR